MLTCWLRAEVASCAVGEFHDHFRDPARRLEHRDVPDAVELADLGDLRHVRGEVAVNRGFGSTRSFSQMTRCVGAGLGELHEAGQHQ